MKMVKSLLLASVAGLAATAGAQAADLPVKAKPVEYVKICSLYGAGFFYLPGTETCLKIGGYASYEAVFGTAGASHVQRLNGDIALGTRAQDRFTQRGRLNLSFDTRTQTEYGTLRTYTLLDVFANTSNADYNTPVTNNSFTTIPAYVFIQLAGFTVGKAVALTRPDFVSSPLWSTAFLFGAGDMGSGQVGTVQAAYTAEFGNGMKLTVGVQESTYGRQPIWDTTNAATSPFATAWGNNTYGGQSWPDFVANFQVNQAWGSFSLAGLVRNVNATYYQTTGTSSTTIVETNGGPNNKIGWGIVGGLEIKNIPTGAGDRIHLFGGVAEGVGHLLHTITPGPSMLGLTGSTSLPGAYQSIAYGPFLDAVYSAPGGVGGGFTQGNLQLTRFYGGQAGYEHYWVPGKLRSSIFGGFELVRYNNNAKAAMCLSMQRSTAAGGQALSGNSNCDMDVNLYQAGTRTVFTVAPGFDLYFEGLYTRVNSKLSGTITPAAANLMPGAAQGAIYELKPQNVFSGEFRAIRAF